MQQLVEKLTSEIAKRPPPPQPSLSEADVAMGTSSRAPPNANMAASVAQELSKLEVTIDPEILL
eukprot:10130288-Prorocentrum_lima.AAC.1